MSVAEIPVDYDFDADLFDWDEVGNVEYETVMLEDGPQGLNCGGTVARVETVARVVAKRESRKKATKSAALTVAKNRYDSKATPKLFAFPSFDKSDAMVYFPCTFARLINTGDFHKLKHFMRCHVAKGCDVSLARDGGFSMTLPRFSQMLATSEITLPDIVVCMRTTKVENNTIKALLYFKYTDLPEVYNYVDSFISDPVLRYMFTGKRGEVLTRNMGLDSLPLEQREAVRAVIDVNEAIQVYGTMELELTIDDLTKKITKFEYIGRLTSICHNNVTYQTICP